MRSVKTVLKAILGTQVVTEPVLQTLLTEVERVLNRALTTNSDDPSDLQPLTPSHFLMHHLPTSSRLRESRPVLEKMKASPISC